MKITDCKIVTCIHNSKNRCKSEFYAKECYLHYFQETEKLKIEIIKLKKQIIGLKHKIKLIKIGEK